MRIKGLQQQLQQATQKGMALERELKAGLQKVHIQQEGETNRTKMKLDAEAQNTDKKLQVQVHDTSVKAVTAHDVAEIQVTGDILKTHVAQKHEREMTREALKDADSAFHRSE